MVCLGAITSVLSLFIDSEVGFLTVLRKFFAAADLSSVFEVIYRF